MHRVALTATSRLAARSRPPFKGTFRPLHIMADNNHVAPGGPETSLRFPCGLPASRYGPLLLAASAKGGSMNNAGKLLSFPASKVASALPTEDWCLRVLRTKDNLVEAIEFLRIAYNEMLAGKPVKGADEILAEVESIVKNDQLTTAYTAIAALRISRLIPSEAKLGALPLFPAV
jgi:hypothetical protein